MDWTEDAGLHQRYKDWREEVELLMDTVLSHIKNADTKMKFVTLGRKGSQDILEHAGTGQSGQSQDYSGQS